MTVVSLTNNILYADGPPMGDAVTFTFPASDAEVDAMWLVFDSVEPSDLSFPLRSYALYVGGHLVQAMSAQQMSMFGYYTRSVVYLPTGTLHPNIACFHVFRVTAALQPIPFDGTSLIMSAWPTICAEVASLISGYAGLVTFPKVRLIWRQRLQIPASVQPHVPFSVGLLQFGEKETHFAQVQRGTSVCIDMNDINLWPDRVIISIQPFALAMCTAIVRHKSGFVTEHDFSAYVDQRGNYSVRFDREKHSTQMIAGMSFRLRFCDVLQPSGSVCVRSVVSMHNYAIYNDGMMVLGYSK